MKTSLVILALLVLVPLLSACVHNALYTSRAESDHPPSGIFLELNEAKTHIIQRGSDGPPVLMIHGASANAEEFTHTLAPRLKDSFQIFMVDRPGHGYSERPKRAETLAVQAQQMAGALEALAPGQKAVIVGHSFGGAVALRLALDRPDLVRGLVLLAPVSHDWGSGGLAWYNKYAASRWTGGLFTQIIPIVGPAQVRTGITGVFSPEPAPDTYFADAALPLLFRPGHFRANAKDVANLRTELAAQQSRYNTLQMPITIYSGKLDTVIKPQLHTGRLIRQVPHIQMVDLPTGGHMPHHAHGDDIAETIRQLALGRLAE